MITPSIEDLKREPHEGISCHNSYPKGERVVLVYKPEVFYILSDVKALDGGNRHMADAMREHNMKYAFSISPSSINSWITDIKPIGTSFTFRKPKKFII